VRNLSRYDGLIIPGGFGKSGVEGKIEAIKYIREHKIPFLGLCYGLQLAVCEFARNIAKLKRAHTTEVAPKTPYPVIDILPEQKMKLAKHDYGATMRLGNHKAILLPGTLAAKIYGTSRVVERHRHRYEVNPKYISKLARAGIVFSGQSPDRKLMEFIELPKAKHPFFIGTQAHPEFLSKPNQPHPLFREFIRACQK